MKDWYECPQPDDAFVVCGICHSGGRREDFKEDDYSDMYPSGHFIYFCGVCQANTTAQVEDMMPKVKAMIDNAMLREKPTFD